ncbi:MAG: hypothetical protein AB1486_33965 [Planctomycetota bacterium]
MLLESVSGAARAAGCALANNATCRLTELRDAEDAAPPGDLILVKDGVYEGVLIQKPLSIVGSGPDRTILAENFGVVILAGGFPGGDLVLGSLRTEGQIPVSVVSSPDARLIAWNVVVSFSDNIAGRAHIQRHSASHSRKRSGASDRNPG